MGRFKVPGFKMPLLQMAIVVVVTEVLLTMYVIASRRAPIEEALPIPHGYNVPNS